jgi:hypothetical protein
MSGKADDHGGIPNTTMPSCALNAIILLGAPFDNLAQAAGAERTVDNSNGEFGNAALAPQTVEAMQATLERNPPAKFDIARRLIVFTSRVVRHAVSTCGGRSKFGGG